MIRRRAGTILLALAATATLLGCGDSPATRLPEEAWTFAVSHILVRMPEDRPRSEALARARELRRALDEGRPFAEVARESSDDESSRAEGGFLGFVDAGHETRFAGAVQVMEPGETKGPLATQIGFQILRRHTFEEGRRLEAGTRIPLHGLVVGWRELPEGPDRSETEARARAEAAREEVVSGRMTIAEARRAYGDGESRRPDAFLGNFGRAPAQRALFDAASSLRDWELSPVLRLPGGYAVVVRIPWFRSVVRHVLVPFSGAEGQELSVRRTEAEAAVIAERAAREAAPDGSNWSSIVGRFSEDPESIPLDGSLGARTNGDFFADIEQAILETPPGRVHPKPIRSPAGYHILWRVN
jgi:hypothetical protein